MGRGKYSLEGVRLLWLVHSALGAHAGALAGKAIGTAKPTHALFIAMSYVVFGIHDYSPLLFDAAASVLEIVVIFFIGRRIFDAKVGVLAASLLAVSAYDVTYARSALSESDANLLFLLGLLIWSMGWDRVDTALWVPHRSLWRYRIPSALILGAGFTSNYRLVVYIAILVAIDLIVLRRVLGWVEAARALAFWCLGLAALPIFWQLVGIIATSRGITLFRGEITYRPTSYLSEALYQLHGGKQSATHFEPALYVEWYVVRQGWASLALLVVGIGCTFRRRTMSWIVPALLIALPYCVYTFAPFVVPRNLDTAIPLACLLVGGALAALASRIRRVDVRAVALVCCTVVLVAMGANISFRLTAERSGFVQAAQYVEAHAHGRALVTNELMVFYLRGPGLTCNSPRLPQDLASLSWDRNRGYMYAVVDNYSTGLEKYLRAHSLAVARFIATGTSRLEENPIASENGFAPGKRLTELVTVYSISRLRLPAAYRSYDFRCSVDRVA